LTSALGESEWSALFPGCFTLRKKASVTHWIGGWMGSIAGLDTVRKRKIPLSCPCWESDPGHLAHCLVFDTGEQNNKQLPKIISR